MQNRIDAFSSGIPSSPHGANRYEENTLSLPKNVLTINNDMGSNQRWWEKLLSTQNIFPFSKMGHHLIWQSIIILQQVIRKTDRQTQYSHFHCYWTCCAAEIPAYSDTWTSRLCSRKSADSRPSSLDTHFCRCRTRRRNMIVSLLPFEVIGRGFCRPQYFPCKFSSFLAPEKTLKYNR